MITSTLNRYITIEQSTTTKDAVGAPTTNYELVSCVWASMFIRSVDSRFMTEGTLPVSTTEWMIRYRDDVDIKCRIVYDGNIYKILSVEQVGRKEALKITSMLFNE